MNKGFKVFFPLLIIFITVSLALLFFKRTLNDKGFDVYVLAGANLVFFLVSILSVIIQVRGIKNPNPHVFVRSVTSAMMLKMLVCVAVTFAYVYLTGDSYNKRSVFLSLFLYLVYLSVEVIAIMKMNKTKNAKAGSSI